MFGLAPLAITGELADILYVFTFAVLPCVFCLPDFVSRATKRRAGGGHVLGI